MNKKVVIHECEFVRFDSGSVWIGNSIEAKERPEFRPFQVHIQSPFWLGTTKVTQALWHSIMGNGFEILWVERIKQIAEDEGYTSKELGIGPQYPMYAITYEEITEFIEKAKIHFSRNVSLPTEAEWELAAQASTGLFNEGGSRLQISADTGWFRDSFSKDKCMQPVAARPANHIGIHDIYGLVWEIVRGRYCSQSKAEFDNSISPECYPLAGESVSNFVADCPNATLCVAKGGSIYSDSKELALGNKIGRAFHYYYIDLGFRLAFYEDSK